MLMLPSVTEPKTSTSNHCQKQENGRETEGQTESEFQMADQVPPFVKEQNHTPKIVQQIQSNLFNSYTWELLKSYHIRWN